MNESQSPLRFRVSYSKRVRSELRDLVLKARETGMADQVLAAIRQIDERLSIYPQFGQPIRDVAALGGQLWLGVVPPLVSSIFSTKNGAW